jgi:hypothetical protein
MWNSGKKNCAFRDKKKYILTLVLSEKKNSERNKLHSSHYTFILCYFIFLNFSSRDYDRQSSEQNNRKLISFVLNIFYSQLNE